MKRREAFLSNQILFVRSIVRTDITKISAMKCIIKKIALQYRLMTNHYSNCVYQLCLVTSKAVPFTSVCFVDLDVNEDYQYLLGTKQVLYFLFAVHTNMSKRQGLINQLCIQED